MTLKSYFNSKVKNFGLRGGGGGRALSVVFISSFDKLCNKNPIFYLCGFVFKFYLLVKRQRNIKVLVYILCIQKHPQSTKQQHGTLYIQRNHQSSMTAIIYIMVIILSLSLHYIPSVFLLYLSLLGLKFTNTRGMLHHYSSINS